MPILSYFEKLAKPSLGLVTKFPEKEEKIAMQRKDLFFVKQAQKPQAQYCKSAKRFPFLQHKVTKYIQSNLLNQALLIL